MLQVWCAGATCLVRSCYTRSRYIYLFLSYLLPSYLIPDLEAGAGTEGGGAHMTSPDSFARNATC
jgi:hypothetical protein